MNDLICPKCKASASIPLGMSCNDHHPVMVHSNDPYITDEQDEWS